VDEIGTKLFPVVVLIVRLVQPKGSVMRDLINQ
jgi:hypothetical protein